MVAVVVEPSVVVEIVRVLVMTSSVVVKVVSVVLLMNYPTLVNDYKFGDN